MPRRASPLIVPKTLDKDIYEAFHKISFLVESNSAGIASISRGEAPDGSGTPLFDGSLYFLLNGRSGGQIGHGSTAPAGNLLLSSTYSASKGFIKLGSPTAILVVDETSAYVGVNVAAPLAAFHITGNLTGSASGFIPNSTVTNNWAGPYSGAGTPIGGTSHAALSSNDGTASYMAISISPSNGVNRHKVGLNGSIESNRTYTVNCSVFSLGIPFAVGAILSISLVTSTGDRFVSSTYSLTGLGTTPTTISMNVTTSGTPVATGASPDSLELDGGDSGTYLCVSYVEVVARGGDILRWDSAASIELGRIDGSGRLGVGTGSATLLSTLTVQAISLSAATQAVKGMTSQTSNLTEWNDTVGVVASVAVNGQMAVGTGIVATDTATVIYDDELISYDDTLVYYF